ncbi:MAG TPA: hypothetical protein VJ957_09475, partial [Longimicrobiales bacterium]|nr:hypothetical protein [Longimicrobiales bacterium]
MWYVIGMILALVLGMYLGAGRPGTRGPEDRVLPDGMRRRRNRHFTPLDLLRQRKTYRHRDL